MKRIAITILMVLAMNPLNAGQKIKVSNGSTAGRMGTGIGQGFVQGYNNYVAQQEMQRQYEYQLRLMQLHYQKQMQLQKEIAEYMAELEQE